MAAKRFTRRELFDLIWSKPMRTLAAEIGVSDVAVRKVAVRAGLQLPPQGHWNRVAAGRKGWPKPELSPRGFGASDEVTFGADRWSYASRSLDDEPLPEAPTFEETIEKVRERAIRVLGRVGVPRDLDACHPAVRRILDEEDARAAKAKESPYLASFYGPRFAAPADRRRLRIANAIALALSRADLYVALRKSDDVALDVGAAHAQLVVAVARRKPRKGEPEDRLQVVLHRGDREVATWVDEATRRLEFMVGEISVEAVVTVESRYRDSLADHHQWMIRAREARIEQARLAALEAERKARERREAAERQRVARLLAQAERLRQSDAIRAFVAEVGRRIGQSPDTAAYGSWSGWALAQADRIDPTRDLGFLEETEAS